MLEWFGAHPVLTVFLILLITIRLWFVPVVLVAVAVGAAVCAAGLGILYVVACVWEWVDLKIRRLRRKYR